jgi:hypothetical protein
MQIPLKRTRARVIQSIKEMIYDVGGFQKVAEGRERRELEDSMGFRGQWDDHRSFQLAMLKSQGLQQNHRLLELGCGPMTGGLPVVDFLESGNYVGVDVRDSVLNLAWREIGKASLSKKNPRLICASDFGLALLGAERFDFVLSFSVLYHLSDDLLDHYFYAVSQLLSSTGRCIANVNTRTPSDKWLEFPFLKREISTYQELASNHGLRTDVFGEIEDLGFQGGGEERHNPLLVFSHKSVA